MWKASVDSIYAQALNLSEKLALTPANISRVAKATSEDAARWAFSQWTLRRRAKAKFALADRMHFDREGLEMATHERVAEYHASLFPAGENVIDLTAGIGADLIALGRRGSAQGFELDPNRVEFARHNLQVHGVEAEVEVRDALESKSLDYWFADPARRSSGVRTLDPSQFSPNPRELIERYGSQRLGVLKLSPMLPDEFLESFGGRLEFISFGGECREALVIVGQEAGDGRSAVQVESGESASASDEHLPVQDEASEYLYEADPAAIRAHCLSSIAGRHDLAGLADSNGYLTGRSLIHSPWLTAFRVLGGNKGDMKETSKALEELGSATPVWKQRGAELNLDKVSKQIQLKGKRPLFVIAYRVGKSLRFVIAERA